MDTLKINGQGLAYRHRPSLGRTIVFANSLGSDQSLWDDVIAALPGGFGVVTYDLRGHGQSSESAEPFTIDDLADDAAGLIESLGLSDVLFCGVSIGGLIGQSLAYRRPELLSGAILCNTTFQIGPPSRWDERIGMIRAEGVAGIAEMIIGNWFGAAYADPARLELHQNMVARTPDEGYIAACQAIQAADFSHTAARIDLPVLCVGGDEDKSVSAAQVRGMADKIPGARVEILEGVGHLPPLEVPDYLACLIEGFDTPPDGMATRRRVLGAGHVEKASGAVTNLDAAFQALITEGAWGQVWSSPGISPRERSMLTLALLAAQGNFEEIPMHVRACAHTGATARDIAEAFQHVAIYAGVPRANHALKLAKATLAET